jgi:hypothetical protein
VISAAALVGACQHPAHRAASDPSRLPTNRPVRRADLITRPEARLYFPGSVVDRVVGSDQTPNRESEEPNPAYVGAVLSARTSASALLAWYGEVLRNRGFVPARYYLPSTQSLGQAWAFHHRLQVQVGILTVGAGGAPSGRVIYEFFLVGYPPGLPKY